MCQGWQSHDRARDNLTHAATAPLLPSHNAIPVEAHTSPCLPALPHRNTPSQHHVTQYRRTIPQGQYRLLIIHGPSPDLSPLTARASRVLRPRLSRGRDSTATRPSRRRRMRHRNGRTALCLAPPSLRCTGALRAQGQPPSVLKGGPHQPRWRSRALGAVQGTSGSVQYLSVHFYVS